MLSSIFFFPPNNGLETVMVNWPPRTKARDKQ